MVKTPVCLTNHSWQVKRGINTQRQKQPHAEFQLCVRPFPTVITFLPYKSLHYVLIYIYIYIYIYTYTHIQRDKRTYIYIPIYKQTNAYILIDTNTIIPIYTFVHKYIYICTHTHLYIYIYIYIVQLNGDSNSVKPS